MLVIIGCFNLIYGIATIANPHVFIANPYYELGTLCTWGGIILIIGVQQLVAVAGVMAGNQLAHWLRMAVLEVSAID